MQSILQEAASPYGGAQIAASIELLESYALTPIAPADLQTLQKAVAILTGTVPAAGPVSFSLRAADACHIFAVWRLAEV